MLTRGEIPALAFALQLALLLAPIAHLHRAFIDVDVGELKATRVSTRLTNAFSKKLENHMYALSIYFMHYNFVRIHQTLRCTPAMEAGVTDRLWSLEDMVQIVDDWEASQKDKKP